MPVTVKKLVVEATNVNPDAEFPYFAVIDVTRELVDRVERTHKLLSFHSLAEAAVFWTIAWEVGQAVQGNIGRDGLYVCESHLVVHDQGCAFRRGDVIKAITCDIPLDTLRDALNGSDPVSYYGGDEDSLRELYSREENPA